MKYSRILSDKIKDINTQSTTKKKRGIFSIKKPPDDDALDGLDQTNNVSYKKLKNLIRKMHPTDPDSY